MAATRQRTDKAGIYYVDRKDGTRTYIATWKEERPIKPTDPLATAPRTVARRAATFEEACKLQAEGEAAERARDRKPPQSLVERRAERVAALKFFEWRMRR